VPEATGSALANVIFGGGGADTGARSGCERQVIGGMGPDKPFGDGGNDTVNSRDGVNGNDSLDGGVGTDNCIRDASELSVQRCP
jgi:Ca2+-binding RTX toxin-like protein